MAQSPSSHYTPASSGLVSSALKEAASSSWVLTRWLYFLSLWMWWWVQLVNFNVAARRCWRWTELATSSQHNWGLDAGYSAARPDAWVLQLLICELCFPPVGVFLCFSPAHPVKGCFWCCKPLLQAHCWLLTPTLLKSRRMCTCILLAQVGVCVCVVLTWHLWGCFISLWLLLHLPHEIRLPCIFNSAPTVNEATPQVQNNGLLEAEELSISIYSLIQAKKKSIWNTIQKKWQLEHNTCAAHWQLLIPENSDWRPKFGNMQPSTHALLNQWLKLDLQYLHAN